MEKKKIELRNPHAVRPWQHVLEPLFGYLLLGAKMSEDGPTYCDAWNFGPKDYGVISVEELVEGVIAEWGEGDWSDISFGKSRYETSRLCLDSTKAKILLGWEPRLSLKDALAFTVYWYKNYLKEDCYEICCNQIERYMDLL
jgi:CDP-glucose 4,6-dehydratase